MPYNWYVPKLPTMFWSFTFPTNLVASQRLILFLIIISSSAEEGNGKYLCASLGLKSKLDQYLEGRDPQGKLSRKTVAMSTCYEEGR